MGIKLHQFEMSKDSCRYIFKSGKIAVFEGGMYRTTLESEISELNAEIAAGIGAIWIPEGAAIVDSDELDPVAVFKRKIIAEYEENKARSLDNGSSTSDQNTGALIGGTANSRSMAPISAGATSSQIGAARAVAPGSIRLK